MDSTSGIYFVCASVAGLLWTIIDLSRIPGSVCSSDHQWRADTDDWSHQEDAEPILEREL